MLLDIITCIFFIIIGFALFLYADEVYDYLAKKMPPLTGIWAEFEKSHGSSLRTYRRLFGLLVVLVFIIRLIIVLFF